MAKVDGTLLKVINHIEKNALVIFDDFGLQPLEVYLCTRNYDLSRGGTFETAKAGTFHSVTAGTLIPLSSYYYL